MKTHRIVFAVLSLFASLVPAQTRLPVGPAGATSELVSLPGQLPPIVSVAPDLGSVPGEMPLTHLVLQLKRTPEQELAVEQTLDDMQNPNSTNFHQWLTAAEFGQRFGVATEQVNQVTTWLSANGFQVEGINDARTAIRFSGNANQVQQAFHTQIHNFAIGGATHFSSTTQPSVPAYLSGVIEGISLTDLKPQPLVHGASAVQRDPQTGLYKQVGVADPEDSVTYNGNTLHLVTPGDFAQIYNLKPLWNSGYRGLGQRVAVVEDTLMYAPDQATFRQQFGLTGYAGTFSQGTPAGALPCANPGVTANSLEAALDAEWAGATAPDATIYLAGCADTMTQFGGLIAVENLLSQTPLPTTVSMSYGECEAYMGSIESAQFNYIFQQAAAEGVTVFVSAGDDGAAGCDNHVTYAANGVHTSGFATTPYATAVGGTDFYAPLQGTNSTYWNTTNSSTYVSAVSYIPEMTWNNSCANSALLSYASVTIAYGPTGYCNNAGRNYHSVVAGSGGFSTLYAKPSWQSVYGNPADSHRDIPDVSLFAASGFFGNAYAYCDSQALYGGHACDFSNPANATYNAAGGTSFAAPALAGVFSLISQKYGKQGNVNVGLYTLARSQYGTATTPSATISNCDSTLGNAVGSTCTFYDVKQGSIDVPCYGVVNCYGSVSGTYGVLSTDTDTLNPAYPTTPGWDFATGLGTINATNLFNNWITVAVTGFVVPDPIRRQPVLHPVSPITGGRRPDVVPGGKSNEVSSTPVMETHSTTPSLLALPAPALPANEIVLAPIAVPSVDPNVSTSDPDPSSDSVTQDTNQDKNQDKKKATAGIATTPATRLPETVNQ
jgi:subtilase family serine protease